MTPDLTLELTGHPVGLPTLREIWMSATDEESGFRISLSEEARSRVQEARATVNEVIESGKSGGRAVYGVNTGFGQLANVRIDDDHLTQLQHNLIRSHAVGVGPLLPNPVVRLIMVTKAIALARGHSGVRPKLIEALCALINHDIYPLIPAKGSVGASGDLAPLAHMSRVLIGEGDAFYQGEKLGAVDALTQAGLEPIELAPKEGLALLNGTQVSTALALAALFRAEHALAAGLLAGAMSADAMKGADTPFDDRIHALRGQRGQSDVAGVLRSLIDGSEIRDSHIDCKRVQDPYSIRCQPQVMGACLDTLRHAASVLETEANAVTDNPLVFPDTGDILSGGNFHAEPVAFVADYMALAIAEIGSLSERRMALLIDASLSELPAFLVHDSGLNSGFMMLQVTAAALVSENKTLAHPASIDTIPTSANQEDHVSMATFAARRLHDMLDNILNVVAIELLAATQGLEFQLPRKTSFALQDASRKVRMISASYTDDRSLASEIESLARLIDQGEFRHYADSILPGSSV